MAAMTNYEDNIFFLNTIVKTLRSGVTLDIDPDYFREKIVEDIFFVDSSLARIYSSLKENVHMIRRTEYLRDLMRAKKIFVDFLSEILDGEMAFSPHLDSYFSKLRAARSEHLADIQAIHNMLDEPEMAEPEEADTISKAEYQFLFQNDEPAEDE